tara:strand:- start:2187 stop:2393 length:207 start_codon:yes stop_codon:yes gene_type:complete
LKEFVNKIKDLKDEINVELDGNIADIIKDPKSWAESLAESIIARNADKIIKSRKLGEEFGKKINNNKS